MRARTCIWKELAVSFDGMLLSLRSKFSNISDLFLNYVPLISLFSNKQTNDFQNLYQILDLKLEQLRYAIFVRGKD